MQKATYTDMLYRSVSFNTLLDDAVNSIPMAKSVPYTTSIYNWKLTRLCIATTFLVYNKAVSHSLLFMAI